MNDASQLRSSSRESKGSSRDGETSREGKHRVKHIKDRTEMEALREAALDVQGKLHRVEGFRRDATAGKSPALTPVADDKSRPRRTSMDGGERTVAEYQQQVPPSLAQC